MSKVRKKCINFVSTIAYIMKILVNTPSLKLLGGVAGHYDGLRNFWTENVKYNTVGRRSTRSHTGVLWLPFDIVKFIFRLLSFRPDVVLLNPSFDRAAMTRDSVFINMSRALGFRTAVFIHGFDYGYAAVADKKATARLLNRADLLFLLAGEFEKVLKSWGVETPVCLTTTKVDDNLLELVKPCERDGSINNILFLSRIEETKGIYIALDTFKILKQTHHELKLTVVGDGDELPKAKKYVTDNGISDVIFTGRLSGRELAGTFEKADIYIFPSYTEGMPTSVLEAMAFGLPVFTRYVGGLKDFFEDGKMGYITDSKRPEDFASAIERFIVDRGLSARVSEYNARYARQHFMASSVARRIEQSLERLCH